MLLPHGGWCLKSCFWVLFSSQIGKQKNIKCKTCIYLFHKCKAVPFLLCVQAYLWSTALQCPTAPPSRLSSPYVLRVPSLPSPQSPASSQGGRCSAPSAPAGTAYNQPWVRLRPPMTWNYIISYCSSEDLHNTIRGPDIPSK